MKIFDRFKGSINVHKIEERIFNILLLISSGIGLPIITGNLIQGLPIITVINQIILSSCSIFIYFLSIRKHLYLKFTFCLILLICITVHWMFNGGGSSGGIQYFFMYTFIAAAIILRGKRLIIYIVINCIVLLSLLFYEYFDGSLIVQYADKTSRLIDIIVSASMTFVLAAFVVRIIYNEIDIERRKSENLLLNILPKKIIHDLREKDVTNPEVFPNVTVLFSDIVGFTEISEQMPVRELIHNLNEIFTLFDIITEINNCERIKTIGDAYLAVCGLPEPNQNHCINIVNTAVEMINRIHKMNIEKNTNWQIRIGIHSGEVIGSVVGVKKYIYDIFGDTVNIASRLEIHSLPMRINVSAEVVKLTGDRFGFESRGKIKIKGKREMEMFFVKK